MSWWGKIAGGALGFLFGGPLGAVLGAAVGHSFDRGLDGGLDGGFDGEHPGLAGAAANRERTQTAFFTATFAVMGHVAKADGRVSEDEIALANAVMREMSLNGEQTRLARNLFNEGKATGFDLDGVLDQFRRECHRRRSLLQMFLEIQLQAALADGTLHSAEARVLQRIADRLGFSRADLDRLEALIRAQRAHAGGGAARSPRQRTDEAYAILGVAPGASDAEVKKAYRRLMNQHHPDKLVARGLPEEMMKTATARAQEIREAWETIKAARGLR